MTPSRAESEVEAVLGTVQMALDHGQRDLMDVDYPGAIRELTSAAFLAGHANGMLHAVGTKARGYDRLATRIHKVNREIAHLRERIAFEDD